MTLNGYMIAIGPCWACGNIFLFDPDTVDSIFIDGQTNLPPDLCTCGDRAACDKRAVRQPVCPNCMARRVAARAKLNT